MQNRFGLKDLVLIVLLVVATVVVLLNMAQLDRLWERHSEALDRLKSVESQIGRIDSALTKVSGQIASGVAVRPDGGSSSGPTKPAGSRDDSWARPGVPIQWQPPVARHSDPATQPGYKEGGEITEIWEAQTKVLTLGISTDVYSRRIQELVLESLGDYDPVTLKTQGVLADAWQVDPDGLWLRAHIRPEARFSDGKPVTAEDFRWTFHDYMMNEQIEAERSRSILRDSIKAVKVIDDHTVEFEFKERLFTNIDNALGFAVLPKHVFKDFTPAQINRSTGLLMGSGPYRLRNFDPNKQWAPPGDVVLERNEQYWGPRPAVAVLRYKAINEEIGRLNSFFAGDAEIITPASPQFVSKQESPEWQKKTQFLKWVNMRSGYSFIAWNCGERNGKLTPFHDQRVRLAMTLSLDRQRMIRDIWAGIGEVAKGNQPLGSPGSNPDITPWPFNPDRARALFKEAGWEDRNGDGTMEDKLGAPFAFEFTYAGGSEIGERIARFIKDSFTAMGIKVTLRPVEWAVYQDLLKTRDFDAITMGWGANSPESDPIQIFHSKSIQNQGDNFAQWNNADADRLIDAGRRELDPEKRAAIWRQFEAVLHEQQPYTFIRVPPWLRLVSKDVGNVQKYPKGLEPAEYFRKGPSTPTPGN